MSKFVRDLIKLMSTRITVYPMHKVVISIASFCKVMLIIPLPPIYLIYIPKHANIFLSPFLSQHYPNHRSPDYPNAHLGFMLNSSEFFRSGSRPVYREPNVPPSYNFVQNCRIRNVLVCFDSAGEPHRTILGRHVFDNFEQSYSSAVHWARGTSGCTL